MESSEAGEVSLVLVQGTQVCTPGTDRSKVVFLLPPLRVFGHISFRSDWELVKVDFRPSFPRQCGEDDYSSWDLTDLQVGRVTYSPKPFPPPGNLTDVNLWASSLSGIFWPILVPVLLDLWLFMTQGSAGSEPHPLSMEVS